MVGVSGDFIAWKWVGGGADDGGGENIDRFAGVVVVVVVAAILCVGVVSSEFGVDGNCGDDGGTSSSIAAKFEAAAESKYRQLGPADVPLGLNSRRPRDSMCGRFVSLPSCTSAATKPFASQ